MALGCDVWLSVVNGYTVPIIAPSYVATIFFCNDNSRVVNVYYLGWFSLISTLEESSVANSGSTKVWVMDPILFFMYNGMIFYIL